MAAALKKDGVAMLSSKLKERLITLIATMWTISLVLSWVNPEKYHQDAYVNGLFSMAAAAVLVTKKKDD